MDAKRIPLNRLSLSSAKQRGKGAMSGGPLERQLSVAVVTHNRLCLFWSWHAWFHINEEQLFCCCCCFFSKVMSKIIRARQSFRPTWIKEGVHAISVPRANHFRWSSPMMAELLRFEKETSHFSDWPLKVMSVMEFLSLQSTKHAGVLDGSNKAKLTGHQSWVELFF